MTRPFSLALLALALTLPSAAAAQTIDIDTDAIRVKVREAVRIVSGDLRDAAIAAVSAVQDRSFKAQQTDRQTRTLAIGDTGTLALDTIVGDITITAGAGRDATVEIIRESRGKTDADAKTGLERVTAEVDVRGDRGHVKAVYPNVHNATYFVSVSYRVTVPAGAKITAHSVSGTITAKGVRGDVAADTTSGTIELSNSRVSIGKTVSGSVTLTDVTTDGTIEVSTVSGDVSLQRVKARRLTAEAVASGDVSARDITCDNLTLKTLSGDIQYAGTLAKNGQYELKAFSGSLKFIPAGPVGFEVQTSTFSGDFHADPSMTFSGISKSRQSFRGTYGDGGAVVTLKTFSGSITIGK
jgi:hypothetical protein